MTDEPSNRGLEFRQRQRLDAATLPYLEPLHVDTLGPTTAWDADDGGVHWHLELERDVLLPGRLVGGRVRITSRGGVEARRLIVELRGEERWEYETTSTDSKGHTTTQRRTGNAAMPPVPVEVLGPVRLAASETTEAPFELPVPSLGPPTVIATMSRLDWTVDARLDIEGGMDSSIEVPVRIVQPVALLRAGVVHVGQFALYPSADEAGDLGATIELDPVPLCAGAPFRATITLRPAEPIGVRGIRAELRALVKATVSGGLSETITVWRGDLAGAGTVESATTFEVSGVVDASAPPTTELPHGQASTRFEVILDRAWTQDSHAGRDVAMATTLEL
jgi:hypothetical protein